MRLTLKYEESSTRPQSDKIIPFKVKMNMDILNLEGKIDTEFFDNWVQQLESYYSMNQLSEAGKSTIASLKMLTSIHCWWENLLKNMEKEGDPIDTWVKLLNTSEKSSTHLNILNNSIRSGNN